MSIFVVFAVSVLITFGIRTVVIFGINRWPRIITYIWILAPTLGVFFRHVSKFRSQTLLVLNNFCRDFDYKPFPGIVPTDPLNGLFFVVSSPEDVAVVMNDKLLCEKPKMYYMAVSEYLKDSLVVTNGETWNRSRRTIQYGFNKQMVDSYFNAFSTGSQNMLDELPKSYVGKDFDMHEFIFEQFLSIATQLAMCSNFSKKYIKFWRETLETALILVHRTALDPIFSRYKFLLSVEQRTKAALDELMSNQLEFIVNHKKKVENLLKSSGNSFCANSILENIVVKHAAAGKVLPISDKRLMEDLLFTANAGAETTSTTFTLVMAMLALHPETQQKVREEVRSILGESNRPVTLDDLKQMTQLENVIKETWRLFPSVPMVGRIAKEDVNVNGTLVPKGNTIIVNLVALHRNPNSFENPDQFDPNRFLPENVHKIPPYAYLPFSAGPRKCPGSYYAMIQLKTFIVSFIRKYEIVPGEDLRSLDDIHVEVHVTLYFTKKVDIRVKLLEPCKATS